MTVHQGLFGSAVAIDVIHCLGMECWIKVHKEYGLPPRGADFSDKQRVWAALSSWTKDIDGGRRTLSWEIVRISKNKGTIADGVEGFPNQAVDY